MTQPTFPVADIWFEKAARQRRDLGDLTGLTASIARNGIINPITITRDGELIAGERRLTCAKELGLLEVPVRYFEDLDDRQKRLLELAENVERLEIAWQDRVLAVREYTELSRIEDPDLQDKDIAEELGMNPADYSRFTTIARYMEEGNEAVLTAPLLSTARGIVERAEARRKASEEEELDAALPSLTGATTAPVEASEEAIATPTSSPSTPIFNEDFFKFTSKRKFNFIHCDFPYGINADKHDQGAAKSHGGYEDTPQLFFDLLYQLAPAPFIADSAHLMFWFSMDYYDEIIHILENRDWKVNPFPLIWHKSDNVGILPDPKRGPRRVYETAFIASKGDRPIVRSVSNAVSTPSTKEYHMSEKAPAALSHFFRMFVDESTVFLDPTCGSGNSVIAAHNAGAKHVVGLEVDPEFHARAVDNWKDNAQC